MLLLALCSGVILGGLHIHIHILGGLHIHMGCWGIKLECAMCKTNALPSITLTLASEFFVISFVVGSWSSWRQ